MAKVETQPLSPPNPLTTITEQDRSAIYSRVTGQLDYLLNGPGSFYADGVRRNPEDLLDGLRGLMGDIRELQSVSNDPSNILGSVLKDLRPIIENYSSSLKAVPPAPDNIEMKPEYAPTTRDNNSKYVNPNLDPFDLTPNPLEPKNWNKYQDASFSSSGRSNLAGQVRHAANGVDFPNRMQPLDHMPGALPENGTQPVGYLDGASQTATFDPTLSSVPPPRPGPPQTSTASWSIAPQLQMPQAKPAAPWEADWQGARDWPHENPPGWTQLQTPTDNTLQASPNGVRGLAGPQPLASQRMGPPPTPTVQNLTTRALRMKGVPEADIGAAINDPAKMQDILNQYFGRRSMIAPGGDGGRLGNQFGQATLADQPGQASTPTAATLANYLPFGWAGLPALLR